MERLFLLSTFNILTFNFFKLRFENTINKKTLKQAWRYRNQS